MARVVPKHVSVAGRDMRTALEIGAIGWLLSRSESPRKMIAALPDWHRRVSEVG